MNPAAAIEEVARLVERYGASNDVRAWLAEQRRAATTLIFREAGADAAGRQQFEVGTPDKLVTFTPRNAGVSWLCDAVKNAPEGVEVTGKTADAARKGFARAKDELDGVCPALANELRKNAHADRGALIYSPAVNSPRILTD